MNKNDGGPVFPCQVNVAYIDVENPVTGQKSWRYREEKHQGMTLRDHFAGQALAGYFANTPFHRNAAGQETAEYIWKMADAMIAARDA